MKNKTNRNLVIGSSFTLLLVLALALVIWSPALSQPVETTEGKTIMTPQPMGCCQDMKAQKDTMWKDIKAQDAALTDQVAKMNSAAKDKKVDLMAAVITRMMEQRIANDTRNERMQENVMMHMMLHMQMGQELMPLHPTMMGIKDMANNSVTAPSEHPDHPK